MPANYADNKEDAVADGTADALAEKDTKKGRVRPLVPGSLRRDIDGAYNAHWTSSATSSRGRIRRSMQSQRRTFGMTRAWSEMQSRSTGSAMGT